MSARKGKLKTTTPFNKKEFERKLFSAKHYAAYWFGLRLGMKISDRYLCEAVDRKKSGAWLQKKEEKFIDTSYREEELAPIKIELKNPPKSHRKKKAAHKKKVTT